MKAKHSAILLSGLLLLMIGIGWAQTGAAVPPTCPALEDKVLQDMLQPTAWARADWNANASRWEIDCNQMDAIANRAVPPSYNAVGNAPANAITNAPRRRRGNN